MTEHRWSGWPGAWCLDCGCEDPREVALADDDYVMTDEGPLVAVDAELMECKEPGSNRHNPYGRNKFNGTTTH